MRIAMIAFALCAWATASSASARQQGQADTTLATIAAMVPGLAFPEDPAVAPASIVLTQAFASALRETPIDGGREKRLFIAFMGGEPVLKAAVGGARYTASGSCGLCTFPMPITGHTHPYENPFSVQDLKLVVFNQQPSLMVTRTGQIWLAVPTQRTLNLTPAEVDHWLTLRFALFGNRLECPARTPSDGWASQTAMGRRVEAVARTAASQLGIALYVANPGDDLRRLDGFPTDLDVFGGRGLESADLGVWEISLLRLVHAVSRPSDRGEVDWPLPTASYPELDAALTLPVGGSTARRNMISPLLNLGRIRDGAGAHWIEALPTTVYTTPFADTRRSDLPFVSVQNSADCARILVMEGVQTFTPDTVTYSRGWSRNRQSTADITRDWNVMTPEDFPRGQVVPW